MHRNPDLTLFLSESFSAAAPNKARRGLPSFADSAVWELIIGFIPLSEEVYVCVRARRLCRALRLLLRVAYGLPLVSGCALPCFCGKSCNVSARLYVVMTTMQAQASRSNWSDFPPELLDTIAQRIARDRAAVQPFHRKLCSAGYSSLLPICNKWMQLASACMPPGGTHRVKLLLHAE